MDDSEPGKMLVGKIYAAMRLQPQMILNAALNALATFGKTNIIVCLPNNIG